MFYQVMFLLSMSTGTGLAAPIDDQIQEARTYLQRNEAKVDADELAIRNTALDRCIHGKFEPSQSPDRPGVASNFVGPPTKFQSVEKVLHYGGGISDGSASEGTKNWMRASVTSDARFYNASLMFLKELQKKDVAAGTPEVLAASNKIVPIQDHATFDVLAIAKRAARAAHGGAQDDNYLALKIMSLYGYDNLNNALTPKRFDTKVVPNRWTADLSKTRCEYAVLDAYKPRPTSTLYRDGAMGLNYSKDEVATGRWASAMCAKRKTEVPVEQSEYFGDLCNDNHGEYQADYYHVVAASYLVCFASVNSQRGSKLLGVAFPSAAAAVTAADAAFDYGGYLQAVKLYKKKRFQEKFAHIGTEAAAPNWAWVAYAAVDRLPDWSDARKLCADKKLSCSETDVQAAQAIIDRYHFEIKLRRSQHEMGQKFAQKECGDKRASIDAPVCQ